MEYLYVQEGARGETSVKKEAREGDIPNGSGGRDKGGRKKVTAFVQHK